MKIWQVKIDGMNYRFHAKTRRSAERVAAKLLRNTITLKMKEIK